MRGGALVGVMVVVPPFAVGEQRDQPVVAAVVGGGVIAVTPGVGERVDGPRAMQHDHRPQRDRPHCHARREPHRFRGSAGPPADDRPDSHQRHGMGDIDEKPRVTAFQLAVEAFAEQVTDQRLVRADADEIAMPHQEPPDVSPEEPGQGAVGIGAMIRLPVVETVDRDPAGGRPLQRAHPEDRQRALEPRRADESAVREEAVVAHRDPQHAEKEVAADGRDGREPSETPGKQRQQGQRVEHAQHHDLRPVGDGRNRRRRAIDRLRGGIPLGHTRRRCVGDDRHRRQLRVFPSGAARRSGRSRPWNKPSASCPGVTRVVAGGGGDVDEPAGGPQAARSAQSSGSPWSASQAPATPMARSGQGLHTPWTRRSGDGPCGGAHRRATSARPHLPPAPTP